MSHAPKRSLTEIALECGFSSSSDFSRCFKAHFDAAPSQFDLQAFRDRQRAAFESVNASQGTGPLLPRLPAGSNPDNFEVTLRKLPPRTVAYIRVHDSFREGAALAACERLIQWADKHGHADGQWLGYMWDDPEIVAVEHCRYDVGVVVDKMQPQGEVGCYEFPAMRVAEVEIKGNIELVQRALDWIYGTWLPRSGYEPSDQPAFEAWNGRPFAHGQEYFEIRCHLPVR